MHEAALARAALPAPTVILGLPMRPYSLGHELWLTRQQNPFVVPGEVTPAKVREAVMICSNDWDSLQKINRSLLAVVALRVWLWRIRKADLVVAAADFANYRAAGNLDFKYNPPGRGKCARLPGAPFLLRIHQWLVEHKRLTESQAWDQPLGYSRMCWAAHCETEGTAEIYNAHDQERDDFVAGNEARLKVLIGDGMTPEDAWKKVCDEMEAANA